MAKLYEQLAKLHPGMPLSALSAIVGAKLRLSQSGSVSINGAVTVKIDVNGLIGSIRFTTSFPERISIHDLRIRMPLSKIIALMGETTPVTNAFRTLDAYEWPLSPQWTLTAYISLPSRQRQSVNWFDYTLHSIDISDPNAIYTPGRSFLLDAPTAVTIRDTANADVNAMLHEWAQNNSPAESIGDEELYAKWLSKISTPVDWHTAVHGWNYDRGYVPIFWIIRQPNCEKATALSLFYQLDPLTLLSPELRESNLGLDRVEELELVNEIRARFISGYYTRATIAFDGEKAFRAQLGKQEITTAIKAMFPSEMRMRIDGYIPQFDNMSFADGYPIAMWEQS